MGRLSLSEAMKRNNPSGFYEGVVEKLDELIGEVSNFHGETKSSNETIEQLKRDLLNSLVLSRGKFNSAIKFFDVISTTRFMVFTDDGKMVQAPLEKVLKSIQSIGEIAKEIKI